jgi:amino acid permease
MCITEVKSSTSSGSRDFDAKSTDRDKSGYHSASLFSSVLNLIKNFIGASMLAMPYGASLSGIVPSFVICLLVGSVSAFTFGLLGILCKESKLDTYRQVCEHYLGKRWGAAVDIILALYALPSCIGYCVFTCDCMQVMLLEFFPDAGDKFYTSRAFIAIVTTVFILIPLCSFDKLQSLTFTSVLGLGALIYCYIFVAVDLGNHEDLIAGNLAGHLWWPPSGSILGLFPMANTYAACFLVQYNSPKFFFELKNPTQKRFLTLAFVAAASVVVFCGSFAVMGVSRFGPETPTNLLKLYKSAYAVWIATTLSLITTYPFDFDAGRRSLVSMLAGRTKWLTERRTFWMVTLTLIPLFSLIAVFVDNLSLIVGINGSLLGSTVGLTLPGLLLYARSKRMLDHQVTASKKGIYGGIAIAVYGVTMSVLGFTALFIKFR